MVLVFVDMMMFVAVCRVKGFHLGKGPTFRPRGHLARYKDRMLVVSAFPTAVHIDSLPVKIIS